MHRDLIISKDNKITDWKAYRLSYTEQAKRLLNTLSLEEKIFLMSGCESKKGVRGSIQNKISAHYNEKPYRAGGIEEKGIPPMLFADGTRGVVCGSGRYTCFPVTSMRGASFHPKLEKQVGNAIAEEVIDAGGSLFGGVCVNLPYHPGWGRSQETYGEDPCLLGCMGAALTEGVQEKGVIACVKHFAFNSMENSRFKVSVLCSKRAEREVFLPQFKKCIDAGAGAVMSAYNSYNGVPCGHHDYLLNQVLKNEWGFDGFVMNDFLWGISDTTEAVQGGMDMEMPATCFFGEKLLKAVQNGDADQKRIDDAALRIIRTLLAHWNRTEDKKSEKVRGKITSSADGRLTPADFSRHARLALQCAREGITLLKNENHILPIDLKEHRLKIAVLGYLADKENIGDRGSSRVYAPHVTTLLQGLAAYCSQADIIYYSGERASHCRRLAKEADYVIIAAGNDYSDEGECVANDSENPAEKEIGGDRINGLSLKERDLSVIRAVSEVRKDAVVALIGGSTITMEEWHDSVGAVLFLYYPGMEGGTAFAEILFGKTSPGGKLPFVIPEKVSDLPDIDWDTDEITYQYCHGYTLLDKNNIKPLYPFGFGLSYTTFKTSQIRAWKCESMLCASAVVENTGTRDGSEVIQMYAGASASAVERPLRTLKAFQKIFLKAGEKKEVHLSFSLKDMAYYDEKTGEFIIENIPYEVYVGTSSAPGDLIKRVVR